MNFLYLIIKSNKNFIPRKLYRGLTIKKAERSDISACFAKVYPVRRIELMRPERRSGLMP